MLVVLPPDPGAGEAHGGRVSPWWRAGTRLRAWALRGHASRVVPPAGLCGHRSGTVRARSSRWRGRETKDERLRRLTETCPVVLASQSNRCCGGPVP